MHLDPKQHHLTGIVLAGDRSKADSLINHSGMTCKALIDIDGVPMVRRVIGALQESKLVQNIILSGPEKKEVATDAILAEWVESGVVGWLPPESSPSSSAYHVMQSLAPEEPVLLRT